MLAADLDILTAPIPDKDLRNPTRLELWTKRTRIIVNRSKTDATTIIHCTHKRLTHYLVRRLELWAKRSRTIANRSKADATTVIHHAHDNDALITSDTDERRKQQLLPTHLHINYHQPPYINPMQNILRGRDRSNTTPNKTTDNISICAASLVRSCGRRCLLHPPQKGRRTPGAFNFKYDSQFYVVT